MKRRDIKRAVSMLKQTTPEQQKADQNDLWALVNVSQGFVMLQCKKIQHLSPEDGKKLEAITLLAEAKDPDKLEHILILLQEKRTDCTKMASSEGSAKKILGHSMDQLMQEINENRDGGLTTNRFAADSFTPDRLAEDTRK